MVRKVRITVTPAKQQEILAAVDWTALRARTDDEVDQAIADDPEASPLTEAEAMALRLQAIRRRMALSQTRFAERFHIPVATLRDWEQARRQPDAAVWAYIQVRAQGWCDGSARNEAEPGWPTQGPGVDLSARWQTHMPEASGVSFPPTLPLSWPALCRPATTCEPRTHDVVDGRAKPGHDSG